jgi:hypothetical protein
LVTPPRYNEPGQTCFVTVQAVGRSMRFLPTRDVRDSINYLFALLVTKYGLLVHDFLWLGNHWHLVAGDPGGRLSDFLTEFDSRLSKQLNALRGTIGTNFERDPGIQVIADAGGVIKQCVYTLVNAVKAGLVRRLLEWKASSSLRMRYGETVTIERPKCVMWAETRVEPKKRTKHTSRGRLRYRGRSKAPKTASLTLARPDILPELSPDELRDHILALAEDEVAKIQEERRKAGKKGVVGWRGVLAHSFRDVALSSRALFQRRPRVAGVDPDACAALIETIENFEKLYRVAVVKFATDRDAEFPFGTLQMKKRHKVRCAAKPKAGCATGPP